MTKTPPKGKFVPSAIEAQADGSFIFYPNGKFEHPDKSGSVYANGYRSSNRSDLEKLAFLYKWGTRLGIFTPLMIAGYAERNNSIVALAVCFAVVILDLLLMMPSSFQIKIFTRLFPSVQYIDSSKLLSDGNSPRRTGHYNQGNPLVKILLASLFIGCIWTLILLATDWRDAKYWGVIFYASPYIIMAVAFLGTLAFFSFRQSKVDSNDFSKAFFPWYVSLSVGWIALLVAFPGPKRDLKEPSAHTMAAKGGVEWRTQITKDSEPNTWPFKESDYMLGCKGVNGNYLVYIVKTEEIMYKKDRPKGFFPQYYSLVGKTTAYESAESQLLTGQGTEIFQKYVKTSTELCRKAELARDNPNAAPVMKK